MEDWQKRAEHGALEAAGSLLVTLVLTRTWGKLAARREARGRRASWMAVVNKYLIAGVFVGVLVADYLFYKSSSKDSISKGADVVVFIIVAIFGLIATIVVATIITLIVFALIEVFDTAAGTRVTTRPGHFLTLDEVYAKAAAVEKMINKLDGNLLGDGVLALVGAGGALGVDLAYRDRAIGEWKQLCALEERLCAGEPVWVND